MSETSGSKISTQEGEMTMETVVIPAKTAVQINGITVKLAVDTIVEVTYDEMKHLTGYHYASLPDVPDEMPVMINSHD